MKFLSKACETSRCAEVFVSSRVKCIEPTVFNLFSENNTKVPEIRRLYPFMVSNDFESMFSQDCSPADAPKVHCKNGHIIIIPGGMKGNVSGLE